MTSFRRPIALRGGPTRHSRKVSFSRASKATSISSSTLSSSRLFRGVCEVALSLNRIIHLSLGTQTTAVQSVRPRRKKELSSMAALATIQSAPCTAALKHHTRSKRTAGAVQRASATPVRASSAEGPGYSGKQPVSERAPPDLWVFLYLPIKIKILRLAPSSCFFAFSDVAVTLPPPQHTHTSRLGRDAVPGAHQES